jgi:thioredoxin reductase (NADPH)
MSESAQHTDGAHRLVIIGSGPAGWTAAIYGARARLSPVVYTGVPKQDPGPILPGGQLMLTTEVENYPGFEHGVMGPEMMGKFQQQAERFGTRVVGDDIVSCDFSRRPFELRTASGETVRALAVIIATGATANWLGLPNELRLATIGGGVSACAVCDGALPAFRDQPLAVVGGGDTAMEEATYLTKFASEVFVIHRRERLRASKVMQDRYRSRPNARVIWNKAVEDVIGDEKVSAVALRDTVTGERSTLPVKGLFIAIGHTPASRFLFPPQAALDAVHLDQVGSWWKRLQIDQARGSAARAKRDNLDGLPLDWSERYAKMAYLYHREECPANSPYVFLDPAGYIELARRDRSLDVPGESHTNIPGVFAAGDVADSKYRQAVTAAGMGCQAALDAERWLASQGVD